MADLKEVCGCNVRWNTKAEVAGIDYCLMHKAAPAMLKALDAVAPVFIINATDPKETPERSKAWAELYHQVQEAVAQARGVTH